MPRLPALLLLLFAFAAPPARAWGELGHRLIGELAERQLSATARARVRDLLRDEPEPGLGSAANWADEQRELPQMSWTASLHYVNIRDHGCRFDAVRDCQKDDCVVGAIQRYVRKLGNPDLSRRKRIEALKFLVHFVGDVHQPLHSGHRADLGGNRFQISLDGKGTSLHGIWDYSMLARIDEPFGDLVARLQSQSSPVPGSSFVRDDAVRWAEASCALTNTPGFYPRRPGKLPRGYLEEMRPLAEARLREAATHLVQAIETAFGERGPLPPG